MTQRLPMVGVAISCIALGAGLQRAYDSWRAAPVGAADATVPALVTKSVAPMWTVANVDRSKVDYTSQPLWAFGFTEPPKPGERQALTASAPGAPPTRNPYIDLPPEELTRKRRAVGSSRELSLAEIRNVEDPLDARVVDWFPEDHPNPMPDVIKYGPAALGRGRTNRACGSCHLADGSGRPENGSPAGLPAAYIRRQLDDYRNDLRHSSDPRKGNANTMVMVAKAMTEEEMRQAADYFSAVRWRQRVRVVETNRVPKTKLQGELFRPTGEAGFDPIGTRIIEVPADLEQLELNSSRLTWTAYVPLGAIRKGKELVTNGGVKTVNGQIVQGVTTACTACHGLDLLGIAPDVPPLAGRSPSYLARQIFDVQQRVRNGSNSNVTLMRMVVDKLTPDDIINVTAYLASLPVAAAAVTPPRGL